MDAELQRPAAAALANLAADPALAEQLVNSGGMTTLIQLAASPNRQVQARPLKLALSQKLFTARGSSSRVSSAVSR